MQFDLPQLLHRKFADERRAGLPDPGRFYPAEDYHQDYYKKNPTKYRFYRWNCGRDKRLKQVWGG